MTDFRTQVRYLAISQAHRRVKKAEMEIARLQVQMFYDQETIELLESKENGFLSFLGLIKED